MQQQYSALCLYIIVISGIFGQENLIQQYKRIYAKNNLYTPFDYANYGGLYGRIKKQNFQTG